MEGLYIWALLHMSLILLHLPHLGSETEEDGSLWVWVQPCLHMEFKDSQSNIERLYLKKQNKEEWLHDILSYELTGP